MHHHHWDSWLHFPLAAIWGLLPLWITYVEPGARALTVLLGLIIAVLQVAYLIRKHIHLGKK